MADRLEKLEMFLLCFSYIFSELTLSWFLENFFLNYSIIYIFNNFTGLLSEASAKAL